MSEDKSVKKVNSEHSPKGEMGQKYLAAGKAVSMRLWEKEEPGEPKPEESREYETVGYVRRRPGRVAPGRPEDPLGAR